METDIEFFHLSKGMEMENRWWSTSEMEDKNAEASIERIRERFGKTDLSISSYDTAWVAMVPPNRDSQNHNHHQPSFPDCLEWVMENQKADGSWGLDLSHPSLVKDSLSSTLACVLALQKWKVGENLVQKACIHSCRGSRLAYFAEGLGESYDWKEVIKSEQRSNGSLFNSPAATAASLISLHDDKCFDYLDSLLKIHGKAGSYLDDWTPKPSEVGIPGPNKWLKDHRVGGLFSNWQLVPCYYFHVAALWVGPEFSDARKSWTKSSVVATLIDDLFDTDGTQEEFLNFV
ncbi:hypothetical protein LguiB_001748 [Lonicera macranthoides]